MQKLKVLILTDHRGHSAENSLYALAKAMKLHPRCECVDVASKGILENDLFFDQHTGSELQVSSVDDSFGFSPAGKAFIENVRNESLHNYEVVWLRMPPPLSERFLKFLNDEFPDQLIINAPEGILKTGSKAFLLQFPEVCPPMKLCRSVEDILAFKDQFPIVLKPLREYGGRGIVKIIGEQVWEGKEEGSLDDFIKKIEAGPIEYLGVKYLKNVFQGDKRIVVIHGKIMGASLRLPEKGSWICNVSMGGSSNTAEVDENEVEMIRRINPTLSKLGIVMYGVDTLVDDTGRRILSEINATSIGGLPQIAKQSGRPLVEEGINLIWDYIKNNKNEIISG